MEYELQHHGIKGQKWGVRRYQNPDGSLTNAGKKRYGTLENYQRVQDAKTNAKQRFKMEKANIKTQQEVDKINKKSDEQIAKYQKKHDVLSASNKKSISEMSDDEIRERINRIRLENELKSLTSKQVSKGKAFIDVLKQKALPNMVDAVTDPMAKYVKKELSKQLGVSEKTLETASQKLKREAEDAVNRQKKTVAEDWMDKRNKEKEAERAAEKTAKEAERAAEKTAKKAEKNDKTSGDNTESKEERSTFEGTYYEPKREKTSDYMKGRSSVYDDYIDAEYTVVKDSSETEVGRSYITSLLALPEPKKKK